MTRQKPSILITLLTIAITLLYPPHALTASRLLPNVPLKMEDPEFWIKKRKRTD